MDRRRLGALLLTGGVGSYVLWKGLAWARSGAGSSLRTVDAEDDEKLGPSFWPPTETEVPPTANVVGLQNNGNTCFLNSILQAVGSLRAFRLYLAELHALANDAELIKELQTIVKGDTGDAIRVHRIIASREEMYSGAAQQDAQELFTSLITAIEAVADRIGRRLRRLPHRTLQELVKDKGEDSRPLPRLCPLLPFKGSTASTKECRECGYKPSVRPIPFHTLPLSLISALKDEEKKRTPSIQNLIRLYSQEQELPGVVCERCSSLEELKVVKRAKQRQKDPRSRWSKPAAQAMVAEREAKLIKFLETGVHMESTENSGTSTNGITLDLPWAKKRAPSAERLVRTAKCDVVRFELLLRLPPVLCLHLQRRMGNMKIGAFVSFPLFLDLGEVVGPTLNHLRSSNCAETSDMSSVKENSTLTENQFIYALTSVVEHKGGATSGHYVTYRRQAMLQGNDGKANYQSVVSSKWFCVSDSQVCEVALDIVMKSQAYLLFYEKLNP